MKRIEENENRLDNLNNIVDTLDKSLDDFENSYKDYILLNKYYGSKFWFKDKEDFEKGKIRNVKAGVLSEDAVWDLDDKVKEIIKRMDSIIKKYNK